MILGSGLAVRLLLAYTSFLNPDEALHYLLSVQPSLRLAYQASLSTVHPPLLILFLYYWRMLGHTEFWLRLPSVLTGAAFCWIGFLWVRRVSNATIGLLALALFSFSPPLIQLSAEVRQYSFLLLFASLSLYSLERALESNAWLWLIPSFLALDLALLTHYSSIIFAFAVGIYGVVRLNRMILRETSKALSLTAAWIIGQVAALAIIVFLYRSHISVLRTHGVSQAIADTWLRSSIYHPGQDHLIPFIFRASFRLFHYFFWQAMVGGVALLFFLIAVWLLLVQGDGRLLNPRAAKPRELAILLCVPLLTACSLALLASYPFGGSRHDSLLALFAMPAISIGIAAFSRQRKPAALAATIVILTICNLFPAPLGAYIRPRDQNREWMRRALQFVAVSIPPGSVIATDNGGALLLQYYLCEHPHYDPWSGNTAEIQCAGNRILTPAPEQQDHLLAARLPPTGDEYGLPSGTQVWMFEAGWITGKNHRPDEEIRRLRCASPRTFGASIFVCRLTLAGRSGD